MADDVISNETAREPVRPGVRISEMVRRISWGGIWAGLMIALGMEVLFALFGFFIGFNMYNWKAANPWAGISAWSTVWYLVTAGWSMFFGAWCAARFSGNPVPGAGILHGITIWGLASVVTIAILAAAGWAVLREGINVLGTAAIAGAQVAPAAINQLPGAAVNAAQAAQQAGQVAAQVQQNAGPVAQATANIISGLALRIWGGVLLGLITAILGGWLGRPRTVIVAEQQTPTAPTRLAA